MDTISDQYRTGFIAVMGKPNVGKSTLLNAFLGQKIAAVSPRPQTTRKRQQGILTLPDAQLIFIDTPGVHYPRHKLGERMNEEAQAALEHCDLILFLVDGSQPPDAEDHLLADLLSCLEHPPSIRIVLNKVDLVRSEDLPGRLAEFQRLLPTARIIPISATRGDGHETLLKEMIGCLPVSPPFYPEEQVTDLYEREIAADLIREACLLLLRDEVPHGIAVRIDEYTERDSPDSRRDAGAFIRATLLLERDSHKGIVIGQNGSMLKKIGIAARKEIEAMSGRNVYLELRVKVRQNWRNDENVLRRVFD